MDLDDLLYEELYAFLKSAREGNLPLFKNPSTDDFKEGDLYSMYNGYVRFAIVHENKKTDVYVWNADVVHYQGARAIGVDYPDSPNALFGEAALIGMGKFKARTLLSLKEKIDEKEYDYAMHILITNWNNRYIDVNEQLKFLAKKLPPEKLDIVKRKATWLNW
jgi:hypothetical protein